MKNNKCLICGGDLPPRRFKYCSPGCARIGANRLSREVTSQRVHPEPFHNIVCPDCGREVTVPIRSKRCESCQAEADRKHDAEYKQRKKHGKTRPIGSTDYCQRCGNPYTVAGGLQRYCDECAKTATTENVRKASRAWNKRRYSDEQARTEKNKSRHRPAVEVRECPICHKPFEPASLRGVYCSDACRKAAKKEHNARYGAEHAGKIAERKKKQAQERLAAMTPDERSAYRDKVNAQARENYRKRKEKQNVNQS